MIELRNVQKSYDGGATLAVADTSVVVERGEFLGLIGASGCGKTTTLKMINRLEEPSSGEILVNGRNVLGQNPELLRRNIGYVFQGIGLFPHRSVAENVAAVPHLLQWEPDKIQARCEQSMELVGLPFAEYGQRSPFTAFRRAAATSRCRPCASGKAGSGADGRALRSTRSDYPQ